MVFLRSEDHLRRWLDDHGYQPGATLTAPQLNELARAWWWTRLDSAWRPRASADSQSILDGVGLTGEFWALQ